MNHIASVQEFQIASARFIDSTNWYLLHILLFSLEIIQIVLWFSSPFDFYDKLLLFVREWKKMKKKIVNL